MKTYKCRECGCEFDEPHRWVEHHGFTDGFGERWSACPQCGDTDYDFAYRVAQEEEGC